MDIVGIIVKVLLMGAIFAVIGWVYHLFMMATSKKYREKEKAEKEVNKKIKEKIERIGAIENNSEFINTIYDSYLQNFEILCFQKYKSELVDFKNENNIVNIIFNSFLTRNLWNLENALVKVKKRNIENESVSIYLKVVKEVDKEKDKVNKDVENFEVKYRKIIQKKLLEIRKEHLNSIVQSNNARVNEKLIQFKNQNSITEETFSFKYITDKINSKEGYNLFIQKFLTEFSYLEIDIKNIIKYEVIDDFNFNVNKELKS